MKKTFSIVLVLLAVPFLIGAGWKSVNKVKEANRLFNKEKYKEALTKYNDAQIDTPNSPEVYFNMGDVFYRLRKYDAAIDSYRKAIERGDTGIETKAYYNIANTLFRQGRLKEALDTYKQALEFNPDDLDTKFNIEFTERKIKEMLSRSQETREKAKREQEKEEEKQQCEVGRQDKEKEGSQSPETGRQKPAEEEKKEVSKPEEKQQESQAAEKEEQKNPGASAGDEELTKKEAERILSTLQEEDNGSSNLGRMQSRRRGYEYRVEKDW